MKIVTIILILAYLLVLPQAIKVTIIQRKNDTTGLNIKKRLPWYMHFLSVWLIMPFFLVKYYLIDKN